MPSGYTTDAGGGVLTPSRTVEVLFQPLEAQSVVLAATPANRIFDASGAAPIRIPKIASLELLDAWRAENTAIAEADPLYDELTLLPSNLKSLKILSRLSNELARNSVGPAEDLIGDAFIRAIAREWDRAALVGDGAANTVTGLANQTGVQVLAGIGTPTVDDLLDADAALMAADANPETAVWFMAPRSFSAIRRQREGAGTGQYLITPDPTQAGKLMLLGHEVKVTTQIEINGGVGVNESRIILADMDQVAVGRDLEPRLDVLRETYGNFDQAAIRVVCRMDIGALNAEAIVVLEGVTP